MALSFAPQAMSRLRELRDMFGIGQRAAVLVEELFGFLCEIIPLMEEIDGSLRDSTGQMPTATRQLKDVTQATELATTEILDLVDAVFLRLDALGEHLRAETARVEAAAEADARLRALLRERLADRDPDLLREAEALLDAREAAAPTPEDLQEARAHLNQILISLQVQDITAQQIAAVNHLIEQVRCRLHRLVQRLADEAVADEASQAPDPETFNPGARYDRTGSRQQMADRLTAGEAPDAVAEPAESASQDDIDALFGTFSTGDGAASQDDIDALFGAAPASSGPASQDDIDALFGG